MCVCVCVWEGEGENRNDNGKVGSFTIELGETDAFPVQFTRRRSRAGDDGGRGVHGGRGSFREFRDGKSFRGVRCVITDTAEGSWGGGERGGGRERGIRRKNQLTLAQSENRRRV